MPAGGQRQQRRDAAPADREDEVALGQALAQLEDAPGALDAALVGHRVRAERHADPPAEQIVVVLGDDVAAGEAVAEHVLEGAGGALHALAAPTTRMRPTRSRSITSSRP